MSHIIMQSHHQAKGRIVGRMGLVLLHLLLVRLILLSLLVFIFLQFLLLHQFLCHGYIIMVFSLDKVTQ